MNTKTQERIERRIELSPYTFWETRSGQGPPVVLIHGLGGSGEWWRRNLDALAASHTVSAIDLIGFGRNRFFLRRSRLPLRFQEIAALLARWIGSEFDEPVHLVGNSMGGHIAIHLAAHHPEVVRSLTLVDSTGIPFRMDPRPHLAHLAVPPGALSFAQVLARDLFRAGPASFVIALARLLRDDARPLLRTLRMPVLLIWGEHDPLVPLRYGREMHALIEGSELCVIARAGHIPMWENPAEFNATLIRFLDQHDRLAPAPRLRAAFSWGISGWTAGIAHRSSGHGPCAVLLHGLGMSSEYFRPFASALFDRGFRVLAPDLPGFGASADAPAAGPEEHARVLEKWAEANGVSSAVWIGHSIGCNASERLAATRRDLVRHAIGIGPLWSTRRSLIRLGADLAADAFREPPRLFARVLKAYWRCGVARWLGTFRRYLADCRREAPREMAFIAGRRDPLVDRSTLSCVEVPGAHACHFSHPEATADAIEALLASVTAPEERSREGSSAPASSDRER